MIIRNGFVRNDIGTWRNLDTIKYFDISGNGREGGFCIIAMLREFNEEDAGEEDGEWHIGDYETYDEACIALDAAFEWEDKEE